MQQLEMYEYWEKEVQEEVVFEGWMVRVEYRDLDLEGNIVKDWYANPWYSRPSGGGHINPYIYSSPSKAKQGVRYYQDRQDITDYRLAEPPKYNECLDRADYLVKYEEWKKKITIGYREARKIPFEVKVVVK